MKRPESVKFTLEFVGGENAEALLEYLEHLEAKPDVGRCVDCAWRNKFEECSNVSKIHEDKGIGPGPEEDELVYTQIDGNGDFWVGAEFGCVHFKKEEKSR